MSFDVIILAAGSGKRMGGKIPKVLHKIGNLSIIGHIFSTMSDLSYNKAFLVVDEGFKLDTKHQNCTLIHQKEKLGTAHATKLVIEHLNEDITLILYGDTPFITQQILNDMLRKIEICDCDIVLFAFELQNMDDQYGRLVINTDNFVEKIMEYQDIKNLNYNFNLANSGTMAIKTRTLKRYLPEINNDNAQNEYYLTDIVEIARKNGIKVLYIKGQYEYAMGVNTQEDLANAEYYFQQRMRDNFMKIGVTLLDPSTTYFSSDTKIIGENVVIHQNVIFDEGVTLHDEVEILPFSCMKNCVIKSGVKIGPFTNIKGNSTISEGSVLGNFVEIKESNIQKNVKVKHLSYIGNATIGNDTNIGAGTITCNYDGNSKNYTFIGENCFVGANTTFVAPVIMESNSITAADSTITKDIEEDSFAISRTSQKNKKRKKKKSENN